jgi:hypothetical protein
LNVLRIHKAILATGSKYFLEVFDRLGRVADEEEEFKEIHTKLEEGKKPYVEVPKPIITCNTQSGHVSDENVNRILNYIYHNQDFKVIKPEITDKNVSSFYSQAYVMKCHTLLKELDDMIIQELLTPTNCTLFYLDAIRFENKNISLACEQLMQQNFDQIVHSEEGRAFLLNLPFTYIRSLCESNSLNIKDEYALVDLFERYLAHRDELEPIAEEKPDIKKFESMLKKEELDNREKEGKEKQDKLDKEKEDADKKIEDEYKAMDNY